MSEPLTGRVEGKTIVLDDSVPPLDGKRVRVILEPAEQPDTVLDPSENLEAWKTWVAGGPQGPIEDEGEPEFP